MSPNLLPDTLSFCISTGSEHERRSIAEKLIKDVLRNCDVKEVSSDYSVMLLPDVAVFKLKESKR